MSYSERAMETAQAILSSRRDVEFGMVIECCFQAVEKLATALFFARNGVWPRGKHAGMLRDFKHDFIDTGELPHSLFSTYESLLSKRGEINYGFSQISRHEAQTAFERTKTATDKLGLQLKMAGA